MKWKLPGLAAWMYFSLATSPGALGQTLPHQDFQWRCRIHGSLETGQLFRIRLTPEIFNRMESYPLDARVVDEEGMIWPSMMWTRLGRESVVAVRASPLAQTGSVTEPGFIVKKFRLTTDRKTGEFPRHNRVVVTIDAKDFVRRMEVWGGMTEDQLVMLGAGLIMEQTSPVPIKQRTLDYPESRLPLLVIRLFDDPGQAGVESPWRSTDFLYVEQEPDFEDVFTLEKMDRPPRESESMGIQTLYFDTLARHRVIHALQFNHARKGVNIPIRVYGRNDEDKEWRWVADGGLHDVAGLRQNRVVLTRSDYRYLKVELLVGEQQALEVEEVIAEAIHSFLVFRPLSSRRAYLYFGSPRYELPRTEFARNITSTSVKQALDVSLAKVQANPSRVAGSLNAYGRTLLILGAGIVALLVTLASIRVIRHRWLS